MLENTSHYSVELEILLGLNPLRLEFCCRTKKQNIFSLVLDSRFENKYLPLFSTEHYVIHL